MTISTKRTVTILVLVTLMVLGSPTTWVKTNLHAQSNLSGEKTKLKLVLVANRNLDLTEISLQALSDIFLKQRRQIQGQTVEPINLSPGHPGRRLFDRVVHNRTPRAMKEYWLKKSIKGIATPPLKQSSGLAVLLMAKRFDNAITYVTQRQWSEKEHGNELRTLDVVITSDGEEKTVGITSEDYPLVGVLQ